MRKSVLLLWTSMVIAVLLAGVGTLLMVQKSAQAAYPGQNGKIAFASNRDGNNEIYTMNADGSGVTRLTNNSVGDAYPVWSPDGTKIAFVSNRDGNTEIYTMNADGSSVTRLTNYIRADYSPTWSPDGTKIAFISQREIRESGDYAGELGYQEIYAMNTDGSDVTRLTNFNQGDNPHYPVRPDYPVGWRLLNVTWSPDGSKMAFTLEGDSSGSVPDISTMNANGSDKRPIATGEHPSWSPDGTKLAYSYPRSSHVDTDIYSMNADGSDKTNLTNNADSLFGKHESIWAPDGSLIAFSVMTTEANGIYTMAPDGSNQTRLTDSIAYGLDWQPLPSTYDFSGFFSPINNLPTLNSTKAGNAVPVKFSLNGDQGLDIFAEGYPKSQQIDCDSTAPHDTIEQTATAGESELSYDATAGQYTYMWKTNKAWKGTCRQFTMKLDDGTTHLANFKFRS